MTSTTDTAAPSPPAGLGLGRLNDLQIRHLVTLDAVAVNGTFGKAAAQLGYTQSAISQQIAAIERIVDGRVFDRPGGPRPVRLTPLGALVVEHARQLLAGTRSAADAIDRFQRGVAGRLDVGTFQSVSAQLLPRVISRLRAESPAADLRVFEEETGVSRLLNGELDCSFTLQPDDDRLETLTVIDDPYVLVAQRGQFPPGPVALDRLDGLPMVVLPNTCGYDVLDQQLAAHQIAPVPVFESGDNGTVIAMVRAGMGPAIIGLLCVELKVDDPDLTVHELTPSVVPRRIELAWNAGHSLSPIARKFIDLVAAVGAETAAAERDYLHQIVAT